MSEPHPYEEDLNRSYKVGISSGLEQASNRVMEMAVQCFKNRGKFAEDLRNIADELERMSKAAHPGVPKR